MAHRLYPIDVTSGGNEQAEDRRTDRRISAMGRSLASAALVALVLATAAVGAARFSLRSPAFASGETIPARYTCNGGTVSPALRWSTPPAGTRSLALIMDDPDAPSGTFTHWLAWNIAATSRGLHAGERAPREGTNDAGRIGYTGPCPPSGIHRYVFRLYALAAPIRLARGASRAQFLAAVRSRSLAVARLVGLYGR